MSAVAAKLAAQEKLLAKMQAAADAEDVVSSSSDSDDDDDDDSPAVAPITAAEAMAADFKGIPRGPVIGLGKGKGPAARAPAAAAAAAVSSSSEDDDDGEAEDDDDDEGGQKLDREPPSSGEEEEEEEEQVQISKPSVDKKKTASKRKSKTGASVCPALVTRDSKLSTIHRNPFIGEVFQRGEVFFRVVSTPGGKKDDAYIAHTDNKTYKFFMPSWKDGSIDTHCFDAVNMDDATNIETFVQTDRAHYYTVSQTGAAAMLRHDMSKEVNPPIATRDYKRNAVKSGNRFSSPMDLPNARGDRTWLPWALYHHHINTKNPVGGDETTAAEAAAAASSKKAAAAASNKRKAPGANSVPEVPLLLSSLAKKFIDDDLEPFCRRAQSPSEMVTRLDRSLVQFARTWKLDNVDAVISAMSDRYKSTKNSDKNKKIKLDPESIATDAASFAVSLQVRMFMMVHPVGLALVQDLRNKLQKEAMDTDDSANDFF